MVGTRPTERWFTTWGFRQRRTDSTERRTRIGDFGRVSRREEVEQADAIERTEVMKGERCRTKRRGSIAAVFFEDINDVERIKGDIVQLK